MLMRVLPLMGVALGMAAGLLANRYVPADGIWPGIIIGLAVGIAFFVLIQVIRGKNKVLP